MVNAIDYKTRPKFLSQAKEPYKKVSILKIALEKLYMTQIFQYKKKSKSKTNLLQIIKSKIPIYYKSKNLELTSVYLRVKSDIKQSR